jgi:hypothetical protein
VLSPRAIPPLLMSYSDYVTSLCTHGRQKEKEPLAPPLPSPPVALCTWPPLAVPLTVYFKCGNPRTRGCAESRIRAYNSILLVFLFYQSELHPIIFCLRFLFLTSPPSTTNCCTGAFLIIIPLFLFELLRRCPSQYLSLSLYIKYSISLRIRLLLVLLNCCEHTHMHT